MVVVTAGIVSLLSRRPVVGPTEAVHDRRRVGWSSRTSASTHTLNVALIAVQ